MDANNIPLLTGPCHECIIIKTALWHLITCQSNSCSAVVCSQTVTLYGSSMLAGTIPLGQPLDMEGAVQPGLVTKNGLVVFGSDGKAVSPTCADSTNWFPFFETVWNPYICFLYYFSLLSVLIPLSLTLYISLTLILSL